MKISPSKAGSLSGIVFFRESSGMSFVAMLIYPVGIVVTTFGILALSTKTLSIKAPDKQPLLVGTTPTVYYDQGSHQIYAKSNSKSLENAI
jgi:hypothetical protein